MLIVVFTFLFVDLFDTIGTVIGVSLKAKMVNQDGKVEWEDYSEAIPAFITLLLTSLSYSISEGIMLGIIMYVLMKLSKGKEGIRQITPTVWVLFAIFVIRYVQKSPA